MPAIGFKSLFRMSTKAVFILLIIVLLISLTISIAVSYLYLQSRQTNDVDQLSQREVTDLVNKVSKLIDLPDGTPTVATVTDVEKLTNQPFFTNAQNGDKVLIYETAKKAYLYRPDQDILIEVAPLNVAPSAPTASQPSTAPDLEFTVALYNGTQTVGLTNRYQQQLTTTYPKAQIVSKANAAINTYDSSFLVDIKGDQSDISQQLSQKLGLPLRSLPAEEATPSAQFLIILGNDQ